MKLSFRVWPALSVCIAFCAILLASCVSDKDVVMAGFAYDERAQFAEAHSYAWKAELNDDGDRAANLQVGRTMYERLSESRHAGTEGELSLAVLEAHLAVAEAAAGGKAVSGARMSALAERARALSPEAPQTILLTAMSQTADKALSTLETAQRDSKLDVEGGLRLVALYRDRARFSDALTLLDNLVPAMDHRLADAFAKPRSAMIAAIEAGVRNAVDARFAALEETQKKDLYDLLAQQNWTSVLANKKAEDLLVDDGNPVLLRRNLAWFCTQLLLSYPRQERLRKDWQIWLDSAAIRSKNKTAQSSIADIAMDDDYWFAVARVVERAIMTLPDGKNFEGLRAAKGIEVLQALRALSNLAPKTSDPGADL